MKLNTINSKHIFGYFFYSGKSLHSFCVKLYFQTDITTNYSSKEEVYMINNFNVIKDFHIVSELYLPLLMFIINTYSLGPSFNGLSGLYFQINYNCKTFKLNKGLT